MKEIVYKFGDNMNLDRYSLGEDVVEGQSVEPPE